MIHGLPSNGNVDCVAFLEPKLRKMGSMQTSSVDEDIAGHGILTIVQF